MIPGSKDLKSDTSLLARGFLTLGPAKNMNKQPFFIEKSELWLQFSLASSCPLAADKKLWASAL